MSDSEAWLELCDVYLQEHEYDKAAFCMEELLLCKPYNHLVHQKYAEVFSGLTISNSNNSDKRYPRSLGGSLSLPRFSLLVQYFNLCCVSLTTWTDDLYSILCISIFKFPPSGTYLLRVKINNNWIYITPFSRLQRWERQVGITKPIIKRSVSLSVIYVDNKNSLVVFVNQMKLSLAVWMASLAWFMVLQYRYRPTVSFVTLTDAVYFVWFSLSPVVVGVLLWT